MTVSVVLDASALLAYLHDEPGASEVAGLLDGSFVSSVNWSEVVQKAARLGVEVAGMADDFAELRLSIEPFTLRQAEIAAQLHAPASRLGLSLADRACLALAVDRGLPVITADRAWAELDLGVQIRLLR